MCIYLCVYLSPCIIMILLLRQECYIVVRTGWSCQGENCSYPQQVLVYPQDGNKAGEIAFERGGSSWKILMNIMCTYLYIYIYLNGCDYIVYTLYDIQCKVSSEQNIFYGSKQ